MDEEYDCIVLGTGLKECIISGVLAVEGKKVLVIDKNPFYGGACASLNVMQLRQQFSSPDAGLEDTIAKFGAPAMKDTIDMKRWLNQWQVDLIPKFIMYSGELVKILVKAGVDRYLEFQRVAESYVYKDGKIHRVPSTVSEVLASSLMGFFEKRRCSKFLNYVNQYKQEDPSTHQGFDCTKVTVEAIYNKFGLDGNTQAFLGHACALWPDDSYLKQKPAIETIKRVLLYRDSFFSLQGNSPYVYPRYGLTQLPEAFARLGAVHGSTYMLNTAVEEILYEDGKVVGVRCAEGVAKCKFLVTDPSYVPEKVKTTGKKIVRAICILNHPIPNTGDADSLQIIIPQKHTGRKSDIYVMVMSNEHCIAPKGKFVAILSTAVETDNPKKELELALRLLGPVEDSYFNVSEVQVPKANGTEDQVFVSSSYDESSHFETVARDCYSLYKRITGHDMDLTPRPAAE